MKFAAVFTLTTTNLTLIGYYPHYVNSSPLNWKQYRFVSEETKQKTGWSCATPLYFLLLLYLVVKDTTNFAFFLSNFGKTHMAIDLFFWLRK